jgi:AbrB family looped-hinge helix DNA binding protein
MLAKVFNKGQVVIPAALRKAFGIKIGEKVNFVVEEDGIKIIPAKKRVDAKELLGVFYKYTKNRPFPTEEEIEKATEEEFVKGFKDEKY